MSAQILPATKQNGPPNEILIAGSNQVGPPADKKSFPERVREFERQLIAEALEKSGGRVTKAAKDLGLSHQGLCYILNHRHKDLLTVRTPIRVRRRSIILKGKHRRRPK